MANDTPGDFQARFRVCLPQGHLGGPSRSTDWPGPPYPWAGHEPSAATALPGPPPRLGHVGPSTRPRARGGVGTQYGRTFVTGALRGGQARTKVALHSMGFLFQVHHWVKQMMEAVTEWELEWRTTSAGLGSARTAPSSAQRTRTPAADGRNWANSLSSPYTAGFRFYRYHNPNIHTGGLNVQENWLMQQLRVARGGPLGA